MISHINATHVCGVFLENGRHWDVRSGCSIAPKYGILHGVIEYNWWDMSGEK
jgi:hypothetical protein